MGSGKKGCNWAKWTFPSEVPPRAFDKVAKMAVAVFAVKAIIPSQPSMEDHLRSKYVGAEELDLQKHDRFRFSMPEADANAIGIRFLDSGNTVIFCPHLGRGGEADDRYLTEAVVRFDTYLVTNGIPHTSEKKHDLPNVRDL